MMFPAVTALVPSLRETTVAIYALVRTLSAPPACEFALQLRQMDLDARVQVIEALVVDLGKVHGHACSSVLIARDQVQSTLEDLRAGLQTLRGTIELYNAAYFAAWRYGGVAQMHLEKVHFLSLLLEKREKLLMQVLPLAER
jgi:hypothetical protein